MQVQAQVGYDAPDLEVFRMMSMMVFAVEENHGCGGEASSGLMLCAG